MEWLVRASHMGQLMAQGGWVRTPPAIVLGDDMASDVKKCSELVSVGDTSPREINSKGFLLLLLIQCSALWQVPSWINHLP